MNIRLEKQTKYQKSKNVQYFRHSMVFTVITGTTSTNLGKFIAKKLNSKHLKAELRVFPDGESKITINGSITGKAIVVYSTHPPVDSNIIRCLLIISKAKKHSRQVYAVIPYMGYAKQDKEFLPGEIVTIKVIASLLKAAGATKLIVVDMHSMIGFNYFKMPKINLTAVPLIADYFRKIKLKNTLVISPDLFWKKKAQEFASYLGVDSIALNKQRDRRTGKLVIKSPVPKNIKGRDIIFLDDMISSGGSIITAIKFLRRNDLGKIYVACTHGVLSNKAEKRLKEAGVFKIISTNTIPNKTNKVDVSGIIADAIKKLSKEK